MNQTFELDGGAAGVVVNDGGMWRWRRPASSPGELEEICLGLKELGLTLPTPPKIYFPPGEWEICVALGRPTPPPLYLPPDEQPPMPPFPAGCTPDDIIAGWEISREYWRDMASRLRTAVPHDKFYKWMNDATQDERFPTLSEIQEAVSRAKRGKHPMRGETVAGILRKIVERKGVPMRVFDPGMHRAELTLPKDGCDDRLLTEVVVDTAKAMGGEARTEERPRRQYRSEEFIILADEPLLDALCRRAIDAAREQLGLPSLTSTWRG